VALKGRARGGRRFRFVDSSGVVGGVEVAKVPVVDAAGALRALDLLRQQLVCNEVGQKNSTGPSLARGPAALLRGGHDGCGGSPPDVEQVFGSCFPAPEGGDDADVEAEAEGEGGSKGGGKAGREPRAGSKRKAAAEEGGDAGVRLVEVCAAPPASIFLHTTLSKASPAPTHTAPCAPCSCERGDCVGLVVSCWRGRIRLGSAWCESH